MYDATTTPSIFFYGFDNVSQIFLKRTLVADSYWNLRIFLFNANIDKDLNYLGLFLKIRKFHKQIIFSSFSPRNEQIAFANSALRSQDKIRKGFGGNDNKVILLLKFSDLYFQLHSHFFQFEFWRALISTRPNIYNLKFLDRKRHPF